MENRFAALSLLILVIAVSGCTDNGSDDEPNRAITANVDVTPGTINAEDTVRVRVSAKNTGNLPATLELGSQGEEVLVDRCPDLFEIEEYSMTTSGEEIEDNRVELEPGRSIRMNWLLQQTGGVDLYSRDCNMKMEMPFDYKVLAYRQVQIKRTEDAQGTPKLNAESSSGPMNFQIQAVTTSSTRPNTFLAAEEGESVEERRTAGLRFRLVNTREQGYPKGLINVKESTLGLKTSPPLELDEGYDTIGSGEDLEDYTGASGSATVGRGLEESGQSGVKHSGDSKIRKALYHRNARTFRISEHEGLTWEPAASAGYDTKRCNMDDGEEIRIFEGKSRIISCNIPLPLKSELEAPSVTSEAVAKVEYTYVKDLGSRTVTVEPRG